VRLRYAQQFRPIEARRGGPDGGSEVGAGYACAHHGELLQGMFAAGALPAAGHSLARPGQPNLQRETTP
jgi:hypothetical protein